MLATVRCYLAVVRSAPRAAAASCHVHSHPQQMDICGTQPDLHARTQCPAATPRAMPPFGRKRNPSTHAPASASLLGPAAAACTAASVRAPSRAPSARLPRRKRRGGDAPRASTTLRCASDCVAHARPPQAALYAKLQAGVLARRAAGAHDGATLELSAKLLELNPEVLTAWSLRRDALAAMLPAAEAEAAAELLGALALQGARRAPCLTRASVRTRQRRSFA